MGKFEELRDKAEKFEIKKSWQYLAYIAVVLPGILFLLAYLLRSSGTGVMLARMFHTYNLYVSSPVPNLAPFNGTGVVGLAALVYLVVWAVRRKDWTWASPWPWGPSTPPTSCWSGITPSCAC